MNDQLNSFKIRGKVLRQSQTFPSIFRTGFTDEIHSSRDSRIFWGNSYNDRC